MVKTCYTSQGERGIPFLVDDEDYAIASFFKWGFFGRTKSGRGGALHATVTLARLLLFQNIIEKCRVNSDVEVDHVNGNALDNRRCNLRLVSRSENNHFKWRRIALERLERGILCSLKCGKRATSLVRLPKKRYLYLCDDHFVTNKHRGTVIDR